MSVTTKKKDYKQEEIDLARIKSIKKKLFTNIDENDNIIINTCKKSEREEKLYESLMTCKGKRKIVTQNATQSVVVDKQTAQHTIDLTRKRKRQPEKWKKNVMKAKREAGEEYVNIKGEKRAKKEVRPGCEITCSYKCSRTFSSGMREEIKKLFYKLSDDQKYKYYNEYTNRKHTERKRTGKEESRRKYSFLYYFQKENDKIRVCKKFFCSTLDISIKRIYHFYKNKDKKSNKITPTPQKGKYVKKQTEPHKIEQIINHIKSFPVQESHYCRASTKCKYLDPSLSIAKMYSLYVESHTEVVKENIYRKVFNENFNLSFHRPKKDTCDICCEYKAIINPDETQKLKYKEHLVRKIEGNEERAKDRKNHLKDSNTAVITFDLENIFSLPKANISCFYYTSKLTVYNLTGHNNFDNSATNAIWDETMSGRSGDEIASALIKILVHVVNNLPTNITKLILWSDSCVPQNKNSHMSMALIHFLQSSLNKNIREIEQKFSEPGHGNVQEVDCVHSVIERNLKHQEIYSPLGLMKALLKINSKIKLHFLQMLETDFHSYHNQAVKFGFSQIPFKKIKSIKYNKHNWNIVEFKTSFSGTAKSVDIKQNKICILSEVTLKEAKNSLAEKKIQDIRSVYKYMPLEDKKYMEALLKKVEKHKDAANLPSTSIRQNISQKIKKKSTVNKAKKTKK